METPEEFLKHYHNNLPNDWLFEKRDVVARLIKEYTDQALRIHDVVGQSEQFCDHPRSERSYIGQNMLRCNKCGKEFS